MCPCYVCSLYVSFPSAVMSEVMHGWNDLTMDRKCLLMILAKNISKMYVMKYGVRSMECLLFLNYSRFLFPFPGSNWEWWHRPRTTPLAWQRRVSSLFLLLLPKLKLYQVWLSEWHSMLGFCMESRCNFHPLCRAPEHNPFYSSIDSMPELKLAQRKSIPLVSDLVSIPSHHTPSIVKRTTSWKAYSKFAPKSWIYQGFIKMVQGKAILFSSWPCSHQQEHSGLTLIQCPEHSLPSCMGSFVPLLTSDSW